MNSNEIDDIFVGKKRKKIESERSGRPRENRVGKPMMIRKKKRYINSDDVVFEEPSSRPRKKNGDGFVIYTEDKLGIYKIDVDVPHFAHLILLVAYEENCQKFVFFFFLFENFDFGICSFDGGKHIIL
ncbi:hypothetical protein UlMin_022071 [Ulmus minor]